MTTACVVVPAICLASFAMAGDVPLRDGSLHGTPREEVAIAQQGQWTGSPDTNLCNFSYNDAPLTCVVENMARVARVNIVANPEMLRGRVTANLKQVSWRVALEEILSQSDLCVLEHAPDSRVFVICPKVDPGTLRCLVYQPSSETSTISRTMSFSIQNATWQEVLVAFAQEARLNLAYEPVPLTNRPRYDISLRDVGREQALQEIADICDLHLYSWREFYLVVPSGGGWPGSRAKEWNSGGLKDSAMLKDFSFRLGLMIIILPLLMAFFLGAGIGFLLARRTVPRPGKPLGQQR